MARIRTIKPDFWKNETLGEMPSDAQLLFIGLWNLADRRGFIEDRPKRIKAELFPYRQMNVDKYLDMLTNGFIRRINIDGVPYIHVINFTKHQVCNIREPESTVPEQYWNYTDTVPESQEGKGREEEGKGKEGKRKGNDFIAPQFEEVKEYFVLNGYRVDVSKKFYDYYSCADWQDSNGKKIRNWKQKAQAVWFKPENEYKEPEQPKQSDNPYECKVVR